jgi:hypothetical protein
MQPLVVCQTGACLCLLFVEAVKTGCIPIKDSSLLNWILDILKN